MNCCFPNLEGKRVFITGHTGFKGGWLVKWLRRLGASICGYALDPPTSPNHFEVGQVIDDLDEHMMGDLRDLESMSRKIKEFEPDLIMHLAAQSVVSRGYDDPIETFSTNVMGTANVLESVRLQRRPCAVLIVTSDKCYENVEQVWGYRETDSLGENDPYGGSKGAAELVVRSYRNSFFPTSQLDQHGVWLATARAGNVIGGGDWTENSLIVELVSALNEGRSIELRQPRATRPWQHVLQCLSGYLTIADRLVGRESTTACSSFNIGPLPGNELPVGEFVDLFIKEWGSGSWTSPPSPKMKEAGILRLAIDKAIWDLNWRPLWDVEAAVVRTVEWFQAWLDDPAGINDVTEAQIEAYEHKLLSRGEIKIG